MRGIISLVLFASQGVACVGAFLSLVSPLSLQDLCRCHDEVARLKAELHAAALQISELQQPDSADEGSSTDDDSDSDSDGDGGAGAGRKMKQKKSSRKKKKKKPVPVKNVSSSDARRHQKRRACTAPLRFLW